MASRIATAEEIASIDTWATSLGTTVGSQAAVDLSWSETMTDQDWVELTENISDDDYTEITFTVTYNESVNEDGTFNTTDVVKTFTADSSLIPDGPDPEEAVEE